MNYKNFTLFTNYDESVVIYITIISAGSTYFNVVTTRYSEPLKAGWATGVTSSPCITISKSAFDTGRKVRLMEAFETSTAVARVAIPKRITILTNSGITNMATSSLVAAPQKTGHLPAFFAVVPARMLVAEQAFTSFTLHVKIKISLTALTKEKSVVFTSYAW